jgi:hypothetical protein
MAKPIDTRDYMAEFLAKGKTITVCPAGERTDPDKIVMNFVNTRGRKPANAKPVDPTKDDK